MASNYSKGLYNDYEKLLAKYELEKKGRAEDQKQIKSLIPVFVSCKQKMFIQVL